MGCYLQKIRDHGYTNHHTNPHKHKHTSHTHTTTHTHNYTQCYLCSGSNIAYGLFYMQKMRERCYADACWGRLDSVLQEMVGDLSDLRSRPDC